MISLTMTPGPIIPKKPSGLPTIDPTPSSINVNWVKRLITPEYYHGKSFDFMEHISLEICHTIFILKPIELLSHLNFISSVTRMLLYVILRSILQIRNGYSMSSLSSCSHREERDLVELWKLTHFIIIVIPISLQWWMKVWKHLQIIPSFLRLWYQYEQKRRKGLILVRQTKG